MIDFDIVSYPCLDGDVPRALAYRVYISQLIRVARVSSHLVSFNAHNKTLTAKVLQQKSFIVDTTNWFLNATFLLQGLSEAEFFLATFCKSLEKLYVNLNFLIVSVKLSYVINEMGIILMS